jgi:predicted TIM-barrel fold metal-dependent hydrolase
MVMGWMLSSDSHVIEPPDVWTSRVPAEHLDVVPRVEEEADADWWFVDGQRTVSYSGPSAAGLRFEGGPDALDRELKFGETLSGGHIPELHVKENEADGVWGSVLYPSVGLLVYFLESSAALTAAARAYNDWIADFCGGARERLKGVGLLNVDDVSEAVAELERTRAIGLTTATIPVAPLPPHGYDEPVYDPLWAAAQDLDVPLAFHIGTVRNRSARDGMNTRAGLATQHKFIDEAIARMIFGGVFERFPRLRVVSVEFEIGWAPHLIERMDFAYLQRRHWEGRVTFADGAIPSDFFGRNVRLSFQEDPVGIELRHRIGVENLMWGSDYPHAESTYPRSRAIVEELMADLSVAERTAVTCTNAAQLYGFSVPA